MSLITVGCDIGSLFSKAVVLEADRPGGAGRLLASRTVETTGTIAARIPELIAGVLEQAGADPGAVDTVAATGRGAALVEIAEFTEEEMVCVGVAARSRLPEVDRVVEIGGQSITALRIDAEGDVLDFIRNDKCASGSGRFLEVMSEAIGVPIAELDRHASRATRTTELSAQCGVFVESEVITHLNAGEAPANIGAGLCDSVARIVVSQIKRLGAPAPGAGFTLTGGVARLRTVVDRIWERVPELVLVPFPLDPQLAAALGAALLAAE
jgi:predicted CoA-substrate-specific enzyme activase